MRTGWVTRDWRSRTRAVLGGPSAIGDNLALSFDKTTGQNGDIIQMTITVVKKGSAGAEPFWIQSTLGTQKTVWLGLVGN